ncbi:hypothetical protein BY996DRAFT_6416951 [Phakopsora pachyrhizi]|nr:hypothetical protein BY996DRAFT_6416951 [Phakopsora pachyrhizi]
MKEIMDAASQVAQQQSNNLLNTTDCLIAHLRETSASNSFMGTKEKPAVKTEAGLHNIRVISEFYSVSQCYSKQILGDVNVDIVMASTKLDWSLEPTKISDTDVSQKVLFLYSSLTH